ncbi:IS3 family transposase [Paenibacillus sp. Aloe-11]|uniref:IS3 family transposase n=1 Tax=Paenibacillus sp. Aloe-11 TaxID=1050222 RepID=UPI003FA5E0DB
MLLSQKRLNIRGFLYTNPCCCQLIEQAVREYITFYNYEIFQKKRNNRSPIEYQETVAA